MLNETNKIMKTVRDIYNETLGKYALMPNSLYARFENKLIRFADHACNYNNIINNNESIEELLLIYVNSKMSDLEILENAEKVEDNLNIPVYYSVYEDESDINIIKLDIERFLK